MRSQPSPRRRRPVEPALRNRPLSSILWGSPGVPSSLPNPRGRHSAGTALDACFSSNEAVPAISHSDVLRVGRVLAAGSLTGVRLGLTALDPSSAASISSASCSLSVTGARALVATSTDGSPSYDPRGVERHALLDILVTICSTPPLPRSRRHPARATCWRAAHSIGGQGSRARALGCAQKRSRPPTMPPLTEETE